MSYKKLCQYVKGIVRSVKFTYSVLTAWNSVKRVRDGTRVLMTWFSVNVRLFQVNSRAVHSRLKISCIG
jgi:hypothetical protein